MTCQHKNIFVVDSRKESGVVVRRRQCKTCGHRWTTAEVEIDNSHQNQPILIALEEKMLDSYFERIVSEALE